MRYTLRLLTVQQFERASRLILACEVLRRRAVKSGDTTLGQSPMSIGLWVGSGATPNTVQKARQQAGENDKAKQLSKCPCCNQTSLKWDAAPTTPRYVVICTNAICEFANTELPIA